MKNLSIFLAMLFIAFTLQAQNSERTNRSEEKERNVSSVNRSNKNSSQERKEQVSSSSRSSTSRKPASTLNSNRGKSTSQSRQSSDSRATEQGNSTERNKSVSRSNSTLNSRSNGNYSDGNKIPANRSKETRSYSVVNDNDMRGNESTLVRDYTPKTSDHYTASRKVYTSNRIHHVRKLPPSGYYSAKPLNYRKIHYPYVKPRLAAIYWNANMYRNYSLWYPDYKLWYYPYGYKIHTVSAYDTYNYIGEIARIYGRVTEVWYSDQSDEYYLYFGDYYPYHDFTVILDRRDAHRFSNNPIRFFTNRNILATGLVSLFDNKPEMLVRRSSQIDMY